MKKLRFVLSFLLILGITLTNAFAESGSVSEYQSILTQTSRAIEEWNVYLAEQTAEITEEKTLSTLESANMMLMEAQTIQMLSLKQQCIKEQKEDMIPQERMARQTEGEEAVHTGIYWLEELGEYVSCETLFRDNYLYASQSTYTQDGAYIGTQIVELGTRDDETIVLIIDYDNTHSLTGRFAVRIKDGIGEVIFTKTIGKYLNVVLNVDMWQSGEDYGEWSKKLLLPLTY